MQKNKRVAYILATTSFLSVLSGCTPSKDVPSKATPVHIAVNQYVEHPNLEAVYDGFKEEVDEWAKERGVQVTYDRKIAGADPSAAQQIVRQQLAEKPTIILALATPSAQAAVRATSSVPIVFGAITDPVAAGLVKSLRMPGGNATGSSDIGPFDQQFQLIRRLLPSAKRVGVIRNPGETNSVSSMKIIDPAIKKWGFSKIDVPVSSTSDVVAAARSLVGRCNFIYIPADNTVLSALPAVAGVANSNKIPLFVSDEGSVKLGAAATIGIDYHQLGRATGKSAVKILDGKSPSSIPVTYGQANQLIVNPKAAVSQGLNIPADLMKAAKVINP